MHLSAFLKAIFKRFFGIFLNIFEAIFSIFNVIKIRALFISDKKVTLKYRKIDQPYIIWNSPT